MKVVGSREDSARGPREDELRPMRAALGGDAVSHQVEGEEIAPNQAKAEDRPAVIVQRHDRLRLAFLRLSGPLFLLPHGVDKPSIQYGRRSELHGLADMEGAQEAEAEAAAFKPQQPAHQLLSAPVRLFGELTPNDTREGDLCW